MYRVRGDLLGVYLANEQGTPVKFRDGPAAVCHSRFLIESHPSLLLLEEPLLRQCSHMCSDVDKLFVVVNETW